MDYTVIKTNRKTIALCVNKKGEVLLRLPKYHISQKLVDKFIDDNKKWIVVQQERVSKRNELFELDEAEILCLKNRAKEILPQRVEYYEQIMGVKSSNVKITSATTRYGSCNGKNSICFSYRLMLFPEEAIDYVVVHELAHILQKNHSKAFYEIIATYLPDYKTREKLLKI